MGRSAIFSFILLLFCIAMQAQTIEVKPYLQDAEPNSIRIMWETSLGTESTVEWGTTIAMGNTTSGSVEPGSGLSQIHQVQLTGLTPDTRYYYRVKTGSAISSRYEFITPPLKNSEKSFNIVLMSDMQRDLTNPGKFYEMCNSGVIDYVVDMSSGDLPLEIGCLMFPGDLVDNGLNYSEWKNTFFNPAENLLAFIPVYPVLGNHELNTDTYFKYFYLPPNGTPGYEEHWWYKDYSNVRIIGLDSNTGYRIQAQLDWLQTVLDNACADPDIDFVFAQLHHPHHSELWPAGNLDYTGSVITLLENFSTQCGKPSVHFYGHTHAYSRGNSKEHNHVMMNVATAGGNIDYWGEFPQTDYPEHLVSQDDYGFVWASVQAGNNPQFTLKRISRGNEPNPTDNVLRDSIRIKRYNMPPNQPIGLFPAQDEEISPDCNVLFTATAFFDPDSDPQGATQWQIATDAAFTNKIYDQWRQYKNEYNNTDTQAGDNLTNELITILQENTTYFWRVRYRDQSLGWSNWSETVSFHTSPSALTANLLLNGGAEGGTANWVEIAGSFESITSGQCAGNNAHSGSRLFAVGGVCEDNPYGEGMQDIDVAAYATQITAGNTKVKFGGYLSDYNGTDFPQFRLEFYNAANALLSATPTYGSHSGTWFYHNEMANVPASCKKIRFILMGTREAGNDNDSYFDDLFLKLDTVNCGTLYPPCISQPTIAVLGGNTEACTGQVVTYTCTPNLAGAVYTWALNGNGSIISGQGTHQITVQWNGGATGSVSVVQTVP
ncbi:hypothetical protein C7N43_09960 [Sphingobacteriales bacterium UPWRP_1]|nr:hypothetical protein B6N25_12065 [Sphingobacteriales bacterium TSM_CSS]PSJ77152.1 hypothetical protein C7N43_09960 [Sphingobacteriales bacterium UPWRP_1]